MRAFFMIGPVVQRPSIRPCQGRDRRFESGRDRKTEQASPRRSGDVLRCATTTTCFVPDADGSKKLAAVVSPAHERLVPAGPDPGLCESSLSLLVTPNLS